MRTRSRPPAVDVPAVVLVVLVGLAVLAVLAGCIGRETICRDGEYPVKAVNSTTGRTCVADGDEPPAGYVRYPEGKVPRHIDDEWDTYWSTRTIDEKGTVTEVG